MGDLKNIFLSASINYKKMLINPRLYVVLAIAFIFQFYTFSACREVCEYLGKSITPWVFPFFLGYPVLVTAVFGGLAMLLYCDAPFANDHTTFVVVRTGRRNWMIGQLIYIVTSSFLYTLWHILCSVLVLLPYITLTGDWGEVLWTISKNSGAFTEMGISIGFHPYEETLTASVPLQTMLISALLFWLGTMFLGVVILFFNSAVRKTSGLIAAGLLSVFAYFTSYFGSISIGGWLYYISPVSWSSISNVDLYGSGTVPNLPYVVSVYLILILVMSILSTVVYCRKDMVIEKETF